MDAMFSKIRQYHFSHDIDSWCCYMLLHAAATSLRITFVSVVAESHARYYVICTPQYLPTVCTKPGFEDIL